MKNKIRLTEDDIAFLLLVLGVGLCALYVLLGALKVFLEYIGG